jgi:hypothetical protein
VALLDAYYDQKTDEKEFNQSFAGGVPYGSVDVHDPKWTAE